MALAGTRLAPSLVIGALVGVGLVELVASAPKFPKPRVHAARAALTQEQRWVAEQWPGYLNGVNFGGLFVIEDWMFWRHSPPYNSATLHLEPKPFDQHAWSKALMAQGFQKAFETFECHMQRFIGDEELDQLAEIGINAVRIPVGYWLFDDEELYPGDKWVANMSGSPPYGVNPDGYVTPGTLPLSDLVVKLHNRNMKVIIDMHANPGCSSGHQSHAGILCNPEAPDLWSGEAHQGISGGYSVQRADDGKTWLDVAWKIALKRAVPWMKFIDGVAPGTVVGYEMVNEPDSPPVAARDAPQVSLRSITLDLGKAMVGALGDLASQVRVVMSSGVADGTRYTSAQMAADYQSPGYAALKQSFVTDVHHYYAWQGCTGGGHSLSVQCVCESNLPGAWQEHGSGDVPWTQFEAAGVFEKGWRFFLGEWSAGLGTGLNCHGGMPLPEAARALWEAQKWNLLSQYLHYEGKAADGQSAFLGDFYWSARAGHNWNPDPSVCHGPTSGVNYLDIDTWDWSFLRLAKLGLVKKLSELGFTRQSLAGKKASVCAGSFPVLCGQEGPPPPKLPPVPEPNTAVPALPDRFWTPPSGGDGVVQDFALKRANSPARIAPAALFGGLAGCAALAAAVACVLLRRVRNRARVDMRPVEFEAAFLE